MNALILDGQPLALAEIEEVSLFRRPVRVASSALARMTRSRDLIEGILAAGETVYGVNTGFGKLSDVRIADDNLAQ
ncbi:MAG: aromatic amino acid lyase, partial [Terracidiphilus sp.]